MAEFVDDKVKYAFELNCLYVDNIPNFVSKSDMTDIFAPFGTLVNVRVFIKRENDPHSVQYGFVNFANSQDAERARVRLNGTEIYGRKWNVYPSERKKTIRNDKVEWTNACFIDLSAPSVHVSFISTQLEKLVTEDTLRGIFKRFGIVSGITIKKSSIDEKTRTQSGYGFVYYSKEANGMGATVEAVETLFSHMIDDVRYSCRISKAFQKRYLAMNPDEQTQAGILNVMRNPQQRVAQPAQGGNSNHPQQQQQQQPQLQQVAHRQSIGSRGSNHGMVMGPGQNRVTYQPISSLEGRFGSSGSLYGSTDASSASTDSSQGHIHQQSGPGLKADRLEDPSSSLTINNPGAVGTIRAPPPRGFSSSLNSSSGGTTLASTSGENPLRDSMGDMRESMGDMRDSISAVNTFDEYDPPPYSSNYNISHYDNSASSFSSSIDQQSQSAGTGVTPSASLSSETDWGPSIGSAMAGLSLQGGPSMGSHSHSNSFDESDGYAHHSPFAPSSYNKHQRCDPSYYMQRQGQGSHHHPPQHSTPQNSYSYGNTYGGGGYPYSQSPSYTHQHMGLGAPSPAYSQGMHSGTGPPSHLHGVQPPQPLGGGPPSAYGPPSQYRQHSGGLQGNGNAPGGWKSGGLTTQGDRRSAAPGLLPHGRVHGIEGAVGGDRGVGGGVGLGDSVHNRDIFERERGGYLGINTDLKYSADDEDSSYGAPLSTSSRLSVGSYFDQGNSLRDSHTSTHSSSHNSLTNPSHGSSRTNPPGVGNMGVGVGVGVGDRGGDQASSVVGGVSGLSIIPPGQALGGLSGGTSNKGLGDKSIALAAKDNSGNSSSGSNSAKGPLPQERFGDRNLSGDRNPDPPYRYPGGYYSR